MILLDARTYDNIIILGGYPSYTTIANDIKNGLDKLLNMIENDEESILDKLRKIEKKE